MWGSLRLAPIINAQRVNVIDSIKSAAVYVEHAFARPMLASYYNIVIYKFICISNGRFKFFKQCNCERSELSGEFNGTDFL